MKIATVSPDGTTMIHDLGESDSSVDVVVAPPGTTQQQQEERRQSITGNITRREVRLVGRAHDINRLRTACDIALKEAENHGDLDGEYVVYADAPQEDEQ